MKVIGLLEARRKLSELVERASQGEQIGISRFGKLVAILAPPRSETALKEAFAGIERIRSRAKLLPRGMTIKDLIEEGRR
jgi:prevent-host-death family protein